MNNPGYTIWTQNVPSKEGTIEMWFKRMTLEVWFDEHQYNVEYDVGESAVKFLTVGDLDIDLASVALRYGHHTGLPQLKEQIAADYPGLTSDQVVVTSGGSEAIFALNSALLKPGDHVVVEHPNYASLYEIPRSLSCEVSFLPLNFDNGFQPDLDQLDSLITPQTKLVSLTHPNNPAGSMITEEELRRVIDIVEKHDVYLMFDETYRDLDFTGEPLPTAASLSRKAISLSTMSKCYGLPGIRIGWMATQDQFILDSLLAIREQITITNNAVGEAIALHVLERKNSFLQRSKEHVLKNLATASDWLDKQPQIEWIPPVAGVVGFPRFTEDITFDPEDFYQLLAKKYKSFVIPGRCFEVDNRHFRLGFGASHDEMEQGLRNIQNAVNDCMS